MNGVHLLVVAWMLPAVPSAAEPLSPAQLAKRIDGQLRNLWRDAGVKPTGPADDAEFLRRVSLDLVGRIPSAADARIFLNNPAPDKRRKLISSLLRSSRYAEHFARYWRGVLMPDANAELLRNELPAFDAWIKSKLAANVGYDRWVRELLTLPFAKDRVRVRDRSRTAKMSAMPTPSTGSESDASPLAFYLANDVKPENLAASASKLFLGQKIECAQCHNHPTAGWTREQFWSFAAFFAGLDRPREGGEIREIFDRRELPIPGSKRFVTAAYIDDMPPRWRYNTTARATLVDWMTAPENPYFARAVVNRVWAYFLGAGFVEPIDDFLPENQPSHPELLDELAQQFIASGFDLKHLIAAIVASEAYQLSSRPVDPAAPPPDRQLFTKMLVRPLTPEQFGESVKQATSVPAGLLTAVQSLIAGTVQRSEIVGAPPPPVPLDALFAEPRNLPLKALTIPMALELLNGSYLAAETNAQQGLIAALLKEEKPPTAQIETLYLATLTRRPSGDELKRWQEFVERDRRQGLADLLWMLLNSNEFQVNR